MQAGQRTGESPVKLPRFAGPCDYFRRGMRIARFRDRVEGHFAEAG